MLPYTYIEILRQSLLPFISRKYSDGHCLLQDNDPKHCSQLAQEFFVTEGINWWRTPPESPDINAIELVWHELKEFIRREVKPHTKQELVSGIEEFWKTMSVDKCNRYIDHLRKVIPEIVKVNGKATGY